MHLRGRAPLDSVDWGASLVGSTRRRLDCGQRIRPPEIIPLMTSSLRWTDRDQPVERAGTLRNCVNEELQNTLDKPSFTPPAVPAMTNFLLERVCSFIRGLSDLREWNKQRLLARVVATLCGGRFPTVADAERPGQRMHEFIVRYRDRHKKVLAAERSVSE